MNQDTLIRLTEKLSEWPILRAETLPSRTEIDAASSQLGVPFALDYREFLLRFGAAMVGPYPIYGLRPVDSDGTRFLVRSRDDHEISEQRHS